LARVLHWTSGHPYLTQRLCAAIAEQHWGAGQATDVDALVREIFLGELSKQDNNLQFVRDMLTRRASDPIGVLMTYQHVLRGQAVPDNERSLAKAQLKLAGVVRREGAALRTRNQIYAAAFDQRWVRESMPRDYLPRRLQRLGLIAIGVLLVLAVLLGVFLFGSRSREAELQAQKDAAVAAQQTSQANESSAKTAVAAAQVAQQTSEARRAAADDARATAESANASAEEARHATIRQLMVSDAQAALAEGNLDQARVRSILAQRADPGLLQAESVLAQAAFAPGTRRRLTGHTSSVTAVAFSPDGKTVVSGSLDRTLRLWDVASVQSLRTLEGHTYAVTAVAFSPDGKTVVSGSDDGTLRVWDVASVQSLRTLEGHTYAVTAVPYSPDGKTIVSGSYDGTLRVWDVARGQSLRTLQGHTAAVNAVAYSPDGKTVVSGSYNGTLRVWDVASGQSLRALQGHTASVRAVDWSPDGKTTISGSSDGTLRVWDVASQQSLRILQDHAAAVLAVSWSPDGKMVVSGSDDRTLRVWPILTQTELIDWTLANRYVPELTDEQRQRYGLALAPTATPGP
jgi:Tol biopolymer transport system component